MAAGKRGADVVLVEATRQRGGRVARETRLPGLAAWMRVVDYRIGQIDRLPGVQYYLESAMNADEILDFGFHHIAVATGSIWRRDGVRDHWGDAGLETVRPVGDALSPGTIAAAVWDGRRFADDLGRRRDDAIFRRDTPQPV
jgi:dimethylamine/trimethylamine dehydrogenase